MRFVPFLWSFCFVLSLSFSSRAATFTVSKDGRGQFSSIQAAVDAAGTGDIVRILDEAIYQEQVDIDSSKTGLTLTSANPTSPRKPAIVWRDTVHVRPTTAEQALWEDSIDYDRNGALRLLRTNRITIDGLRVEGGEPYIFGGNAIWGTSALQNGNAAVTVFTSGEIVIRNCDISGAYLGINVKDRNEGGIYAMRNPACIDPWNAIPFSGFGKTGNHLFEHNRIHNNTFGMFFESTWDLGSTIRHNLFYENHHADARAAADVNSLTSDGMHHTGGALWFKDHLFSPLAIYNNTFWHNFLVFVGHWRAGAQHVIFNNIYSTPHTYWADDPNFPNPIHKMDQSFANRMKNCIYACQSKPPIRKRIETILVDPGTQEEIAVDTVIDGTSRVEIMKDISGIEGEVKTVDMTVSLSTGDSIVTVTYDSISPGALITDPFPVAANIRWLETDYTDDVNSYELFKSTDPSQSGFLEPEWDNPLVQRFILDQGWEDAGIRDADGSIADLGAISSAGTPSDMVLIKPASPVVIHNQSATLKFDIIDKTGAFTNPTITYFRFLKNVEFESDIFGGDAKPVSDNDILEIPVNQPVQVGSNELHVSIPARRSYEQYAFFEMIVEGTGANGERVASAVGFLPYRYMDPYVTVTVFQDSGRSAEIDTVQVGDTVYLSVSVFEIDGTPFPDTIATAQISLGSGAPLYGIGCDLSRVDSCDELEIGAIEQSTIVPAVFTRTPESGKEYIYVSGILWGGEVERGLFGSSKAITVLPGPAQKAFFQDPPSNNISALPPVIDLDYVHEGQLAVYDRFENRVNSPTEVTLRSLQPEIGEIVREDRTITTDSNGIGTFMVEVTNGAEDDIFTIEARIADVKTDQADLKVGRSLDKLWIFYGDTVELNPAVRLEGEIGQRVPIQIRASKDGWEVSEASLEVSLSSSSPSLTFYSEEGAPQPATVFQLTEGRAQVWVSASAPVENAMIEAQAVNSNTILPGSRGLIRFNTDLAVQGPPSGQASYYKLKVTVGPNPFVPGTSLPGKTLAKIGQKVSITEGVLIEIAPQPQPQQGVMLDVSVTVFDALGNRVVSCGSTQSSQNNIQLVSQPHSGSVYLVWNGCNEQGRHVGAGTYAAFIVARDEYGKEERFVTKIGVKEK